MQSILQTPPTKSPIAYKPKQLLELPPEIRLMIIDRLDPRTMCIFSRCSLMCREDVMASKNWASEISFKSTQENLSISVLHGNHPEQSGDGRSIQNFSYQLRFVRKMRSKFMECLDNTGKILWSKRLDHGLELISHASTMFRQMLDKFQKSLQTVVLSGWNYGGLSLEFGKLTNIKELSINSCCNIDQILIKFRHPLDILIVDSENLSREISEYDEIYRVKSQIYLRNVSIDIATLKRLRAKIIDIPIGTISSSDVCSIIKEWQNGITNSEKESVVWNTTGTDFDKSKLLEIPGRVCLWEGEGTIGAFKIRHNVDAEMTASVYFDSMRVFFKIDHPMV